MEGGSFLKCGCRLSAARIRSKYVQELHGWRAAHVLNVALALAPRTFVNFDSVSRIPMINNREMVYWKS
eukprot:6211839-Pyramimonas_sp.AAC.1